MKVNELRAKTDNMKKDELQVLVAEMYKQIPKKVREEKQIDTLIDNPQVFKQEKKKGKQAKEKPDFASVEDEAKTFMENAWEQNYFAPNREIPKKERSKWRFTAKRLVDQITELGREPEYRMECIHLLEELYRLFTYASGHVVFSSDEPFYTMRIPQLDFLNRLITLKKEEQVPDKWISDSLQLIAGNENNHNILPSELLGMMTGMLNNAPLKEKAGQIAEDLVYKKETYIKQTKKMDWRAKYEAEEYINILVEMVFILQSELGEYDTAINFYKKRHRKLRDEVDLYILLEWIRQYQKRSKEWMREYEQAIERGIEPRSTLKAMYDYVKQGNELPE
ncbi:hypothetical protein KFZ56_08345 [Virgibacillus sp. NKC19-3]|uniref:hypothetical protein n=1 Tax=Virgibacillus saliphilus TaxID=2831674 RepID=UPI001C9ABA0C|nr:hypothetical protein [Virgibacillus sp. NKC19-3]MBY7143064.1 hypothetical protein [Virgibacillus sp. NKC19-3]